MMLLHFWVLVEIRSVGKKLFSSHFNYLFPCPVLIYPSPPNFLFRAAADVDGRAGGAESPAPRLGRRRRTARRAAA